MARYYSRLRSVEDRKRTRKALLMLLIAAGVVAISVLVGFRLLSKLFLFISGLNMTNQPVTKDDYIPPSPPRIFLPYEATNSSQIKITGAGESGATVYITRNEETVGNVLIDDSGNFMLSNVPLSDGQNVFSAVAIDTAGNKSQASTPVTIFFSNRVPKLNIKAPTDGQKFSGGEPKVEVRGETDPDSRITINDRVVIVTTGGNFSYRGGLETGENKIVVVATDRAGNQKRQEISVFYEPK